MVVFTIFLIIASGDLLNPNLNNENINRLLESNDINEKINFLIQDKIKQNDSIKMLPIFLILMLGTLFSKKLNVLPSYFFPYNLFLFGKEIDRYKQRIEIKSKIIWVVFAGLIISIAAGFIVWYITPR